MIEIDKDALIEKLEHEVEVIHENLSDLNRAIFEQKLIRFEISDRLHQIIMGTYKRSE